MRILIALTFLVICCVANDVQACSAGVSKAAATAYMFGRAVFMGKVRSWAAPDLQPVVASMLNESRISDALSNHTITHIDELAAVAIAAYKAAANRSDVATKFRKAGHAILNHKLMSSSIDPENWVVVAEVPPAAHPPKLSHNATITEYVISFVVPAGLRGVIEEEGRLRLECKERGTRKCVPASHELLSQ